MNLTEFFSQGLALIGPFDFRVVLFLFLLCFIGEAAGVFVPYLFEATWISIGFQFSQRALSPEYLIVLLATCIIGRELGTLILYFISKSTSVYLIRYTNHFMKRVDAVKTSPLKLFKKIDITASPFTVALGRLVWLRIPLTLIMGARGKLKTLVIGVAISSLIYEGIYVTLGAVVGNTVKMAPLSLILYSLAALTIIWGATFGIRRLVSIFTRRRRSEVPV